jgi:hypothetical protein
MYGFDDKTWSIIKAHRADFNYTDCEKKLKAAGGYDAYIKSLGGIFAEYRYFSGKARTVKRFQEICQYVFGLYHIYGFDYFNGATYVRWSAGSPFYTGSKKGRCNAGRIDDLCGLASKDKTTCCNWAVDTVLYKAGYLPSGSQRYCTEIKRFGRTIKRKADLQVGDVVHFFRQKIDQDNPDTWKGWHHVAIVYDVTADSVILADGGSRLQRNAGQWLYTVPKAGSEFGGTYGADGWIAKRLFTLEKSELYRVRKSWADAGSQIGAYSILDNAKKAVEEMREKTGETYTIYNSDGAPVWPYYRVRQSWEDPGSQIGAYTFYRNAAFVSDLNEGYNVYDNWGNLLHEGSLPVIPVIVALKAGTKIYDEPAGNMVQELKADGKYTITAIREKGITYGQLKSGVGWVSLQLAERPE